MASSSGTRFGRQFAIDQNQQTYTQLYPDDFQAGMGAACQMPVDGQGAIGGVGRAGVQLMAAPTVPFASAYGCLVPQPSVADMKPNYTLNAWTNWKQYEGNGTPQVMENASVQPPPESNFKPTHYYPVGAGMAGSRYLVVDNNRLKNVVSL